MPDDRIRERVVERFAQVGEPPCEEMPCPHIERCREKLLSCEAFATWVRFGKWKGKAAEPTQQQYQRLFRPDDPPPLFDEEVRERAAFRRRMRGLIDALKRKQEATIHGSP